MEGKFASVIVVLLIVLLLASGWRRLMAAALRANATDWGRDWLNRIDGLGRLLCLSFHHFRYEPIPLPEEGPALVVSNHVSGLDPFLLVTACRRPLRFLIAKEQYERFGLTWLFRAAGCIPVDREGRPKEALKAARAALERGEVIALFPHGKIHLDSDPPRKLKRGVANLADWAQCPVFPARIDGVKGQGYVTRALMIRSHARLRSFAPLYCIDRAHSECLEELAAYLEDRVSPKEEADKNIT